MELYQQQQQNFYPDVIPPPRSRIESYHHGITRKKRLNAKIPTPEQNKDTSVVTEDLPQVMFLPAVGPYPTEMTCPYCRSNIVTVTRTKISVEQKLYSVLLCLLGCYLCSCIPCFITEMSEVDHSCPNCEKSLGIYYG